MADIKDQTEEQKVELAEIERRMEAATEERERLKAERRRVEGEEIAGLREIIEAHVAATEEAQEKLRGNCEETSLPHISQDRSYTNSLKLCGSRSSGHA